MQCKKPFELTFGWLYKKLIRTKFGIHIETLKYCIDYVNEVVFCA